MPRLLENLTLEELYGRITVPCSRAERDGAEEEITWRSAAHFEELQQVKADLSASEDDFCRAEDEASDRARELDDALQRIDVLEEALRFYEDDRRYEYSGDFDFDSPPRFHEDGILDDGGRTARSVL